MASVSSVGSVVFTAPISQQFVLLSQTLNELFDPILETVQNDLRLDIFPRFLQSDFFRKYIRTKAYERSAVRAKDFGILRVLGRGAFGAVRIHFECVSNRQNVC